MLKIVKYFVVCLLLSIHLPACSSEKNDKKTDKSKAIETKNTSTIVTDPKKSINTFNQYDINGDGIKDLVYYASISSIQKQNPNIFNSSITLVTPWSPDKKASGIDPSKGSKNAILISHGGNNQLYMILDTDPISILDTSAAKELSIHEKTKISDLDEPVLNKKATGDVIILPTEMGVDSFLFWDGSQYSEHVVMDMP